jgi:hypothetical protein
MKEKAKVNEGNNNKHGTWSLGQEISNSKLTCHVEIALYLHHHYLSLGRLGVAQQR